jgi:hypothetical protein
VQGGDGVNDMPNWVEEIVVNEEKLYETLRRGWPITINLDQTPDTPDIVGRVITRLMTAQYSVVATTIMGWCTIALLPLQYQRDWFQKCIKIPGVSIKIAD